MRGSDFRWDVFIETVRGAHPGLLALATGFVLLTYLGRALRWRVMLRPIAPGARLGPILTATVVGFTAVVFFGRPGELVRPWLIARQERVPLPTQLAAWLLERVLDLLMVLLLFGFALLRVRPEAAGPQLRTVLASGGTLVLLLGIACVLVLLASALYAEAAQRWLMPLIRWLPSRLSARLESLFSAFLDGMKVTGSASSLGALLGYTVAEWVVILAGVHFALAAYPPTSAFGVLDTAVLTGFIAFGSVVQLPAIGGGMQVAAVLVLTELFGLPFEAAAAVALLLWILTWLTVVPFGIVAAFTEGLRWGSLRHIEDEVAAPRG
jgi:uncharacterized protein (TIRG00374 family)